MKLSVILPTHNPKETILWRTLEALNGQSLPISEWELLLIDNGSSLPLADDLVAWHSSGRVVREERLGLTHARLRGIAEAKADLLLWVDDDNILDHDYLKVSLDAFAVHPKLGIAGGKSLPEYQEPPPPWYRPGLAPIGCRDLGDEEIFASWDPDMPIYPAFAPIGAGMVTRKAAIKVWAEAICNDPVRLALGRTGAALTSGEDNDMNLTLLRAGWDCAYLPALKLTHLIPPGRLTLDYQKRIARASFRDFVRVLDIHGIRPWSRISRAGVWLRAAKAWFSHKAWRGPAEAISWQSAIGQFEGRAALFRS